MGNDGYSKSTIAYNTGVNDNGWATSFLLTKWQGDGYIYNTSGEGLTYFAALGYSPEGSAHSLNLSLLGAGQWHHQRDVGFQLGITKTSEKKELIQDGIQMVVH